MLVSPAKLIDPRKLHCIAGAGFFDGTNDWLKLSVDFNGNADGSQGICSFWQEFNSSTPARYVIFNNSNNRIIIERTLAFFWQVTLSDGVNSLVFRTSNTFGSILVSPNNFSHVAMSWDTNFSAGNKKCHIVVDGIVQTLVIVDASPAFTIDYTQSNWGLGSDSGALNKYNGGLSAFYFNNSAYLDISVDANLKLFRRVSGGLGFPAFLGWNGERPTGNQPICLFQNPFDSFGTNLGYGGNMSVQGALTATDPIGPCIKATLVFGGGGEEL